VYDKITSAARIVIAYRKNLKLLVIPIRKHTQTKDTIAKGLLTNHPIIFDIESIK